MYFSAVRIELLRGAASGGEAAACYRAAPPAGGPDKVSHYLARTFAFRCLSLSLPFVDLSLSLPFLDRLMIVAACSCHCRAWTCHRAVAAFPCRCLSLTLPLPFLHRALSSRCVAAVFFFQRFHSLAIAMSFHGLVTACPGHSTASLLSAGTRHRRNRRLCRRRELIGGRRAHGAAC